MEPEQQPGTGPRRLLARTRFAALAAAVLLVMGLLATQGPSLVRTTEEPEPPGPAETIPGLPEPTVALTVPERPPATPPARVCGSAPLRGPTTPPAGAVVVDTDTDLADAVEDHGPATTFWLAPGVHTLGDGRYTAVTPRAGDRFVGAPGAILDGRHTNSYAFAGHATGVQISYLTVRNFGQRAGNNNEGVVNHGAGHDWTMDHLTVSGNAGAGVFLGSGSSISRSCLRDNGQYGFSAYEPEGVHDVSVVGNEIAGNNTDDWEARIDGCGCTGGGKFWETRGATVSGNWIHDNAGPGMWADTNNAGFDISGNYFSDNDGPAIIYETSYNAHITDNTFIGNAVPAGRSNPGFPTGTIYVSESGSDPRVHTEYDDTFLIAHNDFVDNWGGVTAYENADRFAGSPANTSTGATTLVNPGVATVGHCSDPDLIGTRPYVDDCRWKTQNLQVAHNRFVLHPDRVSAACRPRNGCGIQALVSIWGTYPPWSPYKGTVVERHITFDQHNRWHDNTYVGPWHFQVLEQGNQVSWATWRSARFGQDQGSTRR